MIDGRDFFDQPIKNGRNVYESIQKIETGQADAYITRCLLDYDFFIKHKMILTDSVKNKHLMLIQKQYSKLILLEPKW